MMMIVGTYPFSIRTAAYEQLQRTMSWRWEQQDRVGRRPAMQYLGPDLMEVTLSGVIFPHWNGGRHQLDAMRAEAGRGRPLIMVDGTGRPWGDFVITQIDETHSDVDRDGTPREQAFTMTLREYGGDGFDLGAFLSVAFGIAGRLS
jgi:phage protein U